jgi:hypothetical protein
MDIDLNLSNYTIPDLERFFGVDSNYTMQDVEKKEQELNTRLQTITINTKSKQDILVFLKSAKEKLLNQSEIIPKRSDAFIYANPSDYFKGTINPIEKRLTHKLVCIDTVFRSNYIHTKSTDFTYTFPETINNVVSMQIKSIEIPYAWYEYSSLKNNTSFSIGNTRITIPDGNYTKSELVGVVNEYIHADPSLNDIDVSYNTNTLMTTIVSSSPFELDFTSESIVSLGWIMGFRMYNYRNKQSYTSESTFGTTKDNYLFVDVDDFHSNHITDAVISTIKHHSQSYIGNNIMARISITSDAHTLLINNASDCILKKRDYFGPVKLEKMNIRILNRFGDVIDLNKNDYSIVFEVTQLYS